MKNVLNIIYSSKATLYLLLIFAFAMATATFVEDKYDTLTASKYIYGAKWFEMVMLLLAVNFIGNISRYNLLSKKKIAGFLFHTAFIIMIIGAGVTRYFGYEGLMHIREGQISNTIVSAQHVFKIFAIDKQNETRINIPFDVNENSTDLHFKKVIKTSNDGDLTINFKNYFKNATESFIENVEGGSDYLKVNVLENGKESDVLIADKEISALQAFKFSYNNTDSNTDFRFFERDGKLFFQTKNILKSLTLPELTEIVIQPNAVVEVLANTQYSTVDNALKFISQGVFRKAKKQFVSGIPSVNSVSALLVDVNFKDKSYEVPIIINSEGIAEMKHVQIPNVSLLLGYGEKEVKLPFSVKLNDFILERYPGSSNPSSYASEVTIFDSRENASTDFRIYMNHILDHDGFRFFQSSYDRDEKGTVLSVNHDFWGTWITYFGYFLLALGFIFTLLNRNSRFQIIGRSINEIRKLRLTHIALFMAIFGFSGITYSQQVVLNPVNKEHAEKLGHLIVQTFDGRTEPVHTLAYDVMHKIARKDQFKFEGKGEMDAMQVFIDVIINAQYWKSQKLIYVREKAVASILGIDGKYASYFDLVDSNQVPKLKQAAEEAFRKKPQDQNLFDKEVIKVNERLEIFIMLTQGQLLRIFPEPVADSKVWISWDDPKAQVLIQDDKHIITDLNVPQLNYNNFMGAYLNSVYTATSSNDYARADRILTYIEDIQRSSVIGNLIPSKSQVDYEVFYNKADIFVMLRNIYGLLAVVLLILAYVDNFIEKKNKIITQLLNFFLILLGGAFAYHTFGMILRWYLSGHAPWSNGYEALLLVGWAGILAGFSFIRYSKIPLAATALLAFFTLMTASHSSYDPQITNLQPVLKSYWLVIHVATLTISYGFLGLAFILGIFTLTFYLVKNEKNAFRFNLLIKELTYINEMNVTIGLILATVGTFLGGIWANESWGRYWGWDAKETWALIITMVYSIVVHLRLVDKLRGEYLFTVGAVLGFSSVLMTFVGVNYYLSKGMHSYGSGDTPMFPIWAWIVILSILALIVTAGLKEKAFRKKQEEQALDAN